MKVSYSVPYIVSNILDTITLYKLAIIFYILWSSKYFLIIGHINIVINLYYFINFNVFQNLIQYKDPLRESHVSSS